MWLQYTDIVDPVLNAIEAITQHFELTLSAMDTATDSNDATHGFFHTLEVRLSTNLF